MPDAVTPGPLASARASVVAFTLALLSPGLANAATPCAPGASRVEINVESGPEKLRAAVRAELATELGRAKICVDGSNETPIAKITIALQGSRGAAVRVDDAVTKKSVERQVDVGELPDDGKALSIAIAADELLRASWAEIALHPEKPVSKEPVPQVVRATVADATPKVPSFLRKSELGARATLGVYSGGQTHLGGALYLRRDLVPWLSGELFGYGREGTSVNATDGSIKAHAFGGGLSLDLQALRVGPSRFGIKAGVETGYVLFEGAARAPATSTSFGGLSCFGQLGLIGAFEVERMRLSASILGLAPFRAVAATDGTNRATSVGGAGVQAGIGVGVAL